MPSAETEPGAVVISFSDVNDVNDATGETGNLPKTKQNNKYTSIVTKKNKENFVIQVASLLAQKQRMNTYRICTDVLNFGDIRSPTDTCVTHTNVCFLYYDDVIVDLRDS